MLVIRNVMPADSTLIVVVVVDYPTLSTDTLAHGYVCLTHNTYE